MLCVCGTERAGGAEAAARREHRRRRRPFVVARVIPAAASSTHTRPARTRMHARLPSCRDKQKRARALTPAGIARAHISASVVLRQTHACMTRTRTRAPFDGVEVGAAVGAADRKKMAALHSASRRRCGRRQARPGAKVAGVNSAAPRAQHASPHPICRRSFEACRSLPPSSLHETCVGVCACACVPARARAPIGHEGQTRQALRGLSSTDERSATKVHCSALYSARCTALQRVPPVAARCTLRVATALQRVPPVASCHSYCAVLCLP